MDLDQRRKHDILLVLHITRGSINSVLDNYCYPAKLIVRDFNSHRHSISSYLTLSLSISYHSVESPAGVGFSYSDTPAEFTNDDITALENYAFLSNWFSNFSEYRQNDFYIA